VDARRLVTTLRSFAIWSVLLMVAAGLGPAAEAQSGRGRGTIRVAEPSELLNLDAQGQMGSARELYAFSQGLTRSTAAGEVVPALAESWRIAPDGKEYTFVLRRGVKFHNGDLVTAGDVKWSLERMMNPATKSRRFANLKSIDAVEVRDAGTVVVRLKAPAADFLAVLADSVILSPKSPTNPQGQITMPIGTGPFKVVSWGKDQGLKMEAFREYWEPGVPAVDALEVVVVPDAQARVAALKAGDVHAVYALPASEVAGLQGSTEVKAAFARAPRWWAYSFNLKSLRAPFDQADVRRAIALGVNKQAVRQLLTFGLGQVSNQFYGEGAFWHVGVPDPFAAPRVDEAKALLARKGIKPGQPITLIAPNTFDIDRAVLILEDQLRGLGFAPKTEISDWTAYSNRLKQGADWDMSAMAIAYKLDPSINFTFFDPSDAGAFYLGGGWNSPEFVKLLNDAKVSSDAQVRKGLYAKAYAMMQDQVVTILAVHDRPIWGYRTKLKNWEVGISDYCLADGGFCRATLEP
jgi:peptide/nickel transport system substrate-binding protein